MCDVVFITLNTQNTIRRESRGTLELATILHSNGINCEILPFWKIGDLNDFNAFLNNAVKIIEEKQPKIVSFYTRCDYYHIDLRLAEYIKKRFNNIYVVFGGPQADTTSEATIKNFPYVDFVCCGEGENTIYPFFSSLLSNKPDLSVDGLVYRDGDVVKKNPRPAMVEDLDSLPMIDYSLANYDNMSEETRMSIEVGRGCPFGCVFCSTNTFWGRRYRLKSPERIISEIKAFYKDYGISKFVFSHDMFTFNREKVIKVCKLLKELDFSVKWSCSARVDCLDKELIDIMVDAGMSSVFLGIETGSPRMQKIINKRLKMDNAAEIIEHLNSKNIKVITSFIYGFPEETEEDLSQTLALMAKLFDMKNVVIQAHLCAFLSATELTKKYEEFLTPNESNSNIIGEVAVEECRDLIEKYPELFDQMMEYKTELRTKLKYFEVFLNIWEKLKPVYKYISETYPEERIIDMYFDFVEDNKAILESASDDEVFEAIICNDKLPLRFADDENYDIISDICRLERVAFSKEVLNGGTNIDMYCFNPNCMKQYSSIRDYPRSSTLVVRTKDKMTVGAF